MAEAAVKLEKLENATRHCLEQTPYRMLVYIRSDGNGRNLYQVAGSSAGPKGAEKALKDAHNIHGGVCFYCHKPVKPDELTIDHADPRAVGGATDLQNLLISCRPCNVEKGCRPIEFYKPEAGREWLSAVLAQVQDRLNRL